MAAIRVRNKSVIGVDLPIPSGPRTGDHVHTEHVAAGVTRNVEGLDPNNPVVLGNIHAGIIELLPPEEDEGPEEEKVAKVQLTADPRRSPEKPASPAKRG